MRPWLQDPDGDGVYAGRTDADPGRQLRGQGDARPVVGRELRRRRRARRRQHPVHRAGDGEVVTFTYVLATHVLTITTWRAGGRRRTSSRPRRTGSTQDLLAWPATLPAGHDRRSGCAGGCTSPERRPRRRRRGGPRRRRRARCTYDPAGLPADVTRACPHLAGYVALRLDRRTPRAGATTILHGQLAVGQYDDLGRLVDATGVQIPACSTTSTPAAADAPLGRDLAAAARRRFAVWAPTAQGRRRCCVWPAGRATDAAAGPMRPRRRRRLVGAAVADAGSGAQYLFEVDGLRADDAGRSRPTRSPTRTRWR